MELKITVWNAPLGQILDRKIQRQKPNCHFHEELRQSRELHSAPQRGGHLQPDPCIHLTPDKEHACHTSACKQARELSGLFSLIPAASKGAAPMKPLIFFMYLFILGCTGLCHFLAFSPVARSRATQLQSVVFLLAVPSSCCRAQTLGARGFSCCGAQA